MKSLTALLFVAAAMAADYPVRPVPLSAVTVGDGFWRARIETNRTVTIPHIMRQNEITGRVANFEKAARRAQGDYAGRRFNDTDVYKIIEAASYSLVAHPDPALDKQLDRLIELIGAAQEKDGYLFPARTANPEKPAAGIGSARWVNLNGSHELYNSGHLYEAAAAHFMATGKRTLLDIAIRNANLVRSVFGPNARKAAPGHEEVELALFKLFRVTGNRQYAELSKFFLDQRGRPSDTEPYPPGPFAMYNGKEYKQDHMPVVKQDKAVGHAVRAVYLYSGMTDEAAVFGDAAYRQAVERLWIDVVSKRMYLTGGVGSRSGTEAFGDDYELPNRRAYTETCASIGNALWNHRMFLLEGDAKYLDVAEQIVYNGFLSGVSLEGNAFFYQNPLESDGRPARSAYFDVACCPANVARMMAQLPGLVYAESGDAIYVNLFMASSASAKAGGTVVRISQETKYPWDGAVTIKVEPAKTAQFTLNVRVPGWARNRLIEGDLYRFASESKEQFEVLVNGKKAAPVLEKGFAKVRRSWKRGDTIELRLPMPVRRVVAHERVEADRGRAALQRGPLVYCVEAVDNGGRVSNLTLPSESELKQEYRPGLLGGVVAIAGAQQPFVAVPYYAWANRGQGEMAVWVKAK
jgi:DUF1680 family protein